jgi:hypothetical protein
LLVGRKDREDSRVPCHTKAVNIEEAVSGCDFGFGGRLCVNGRIVRK